MDDDTLERISREMNTCNMDQLNYWCSLLLHEVVRLRFEGRKLKHEKEVLSRALRTSCSVEPLDIMNYRGVDDMAEVV